MSMRLFYLPGSCAIAPHIALEVTKSTYETTRLERGDQNCDEYKLVNPLGRVPALIIDGCSTILEVPAILSYIADRRPVSRLLPSIGTEKRYLALSWLAYLSSTLHPAFARLWRAERFTDNSDCEGSVQSSAQEQIAASFGHIDASFASGVLQRSERITAVDCYLFVFGRWGYRLPESTRKYKHLLEHTEWMGNQSAVIKVLAEQGVTAVGPAKGPG